MSAVLEFSESNLVQSVQGVESIKQSHVKEKWVPRTARLASLMTQARRLAEIQHARSELMKSLKPIRKPTRAVTSRQKSSKRSAEICRAKMEIYTTLLENENQVESQQNSNLKEALRLQQQANATLMAHITDVELKTAVKQKTAEGDNMSFCSLVSSEPTSVLLKTSHPDDTALVEQCPEWILEDDDGIKVSPHFENPEHNNLMTNFDDFEPWLDSPSSELSTLPFSECSALVDEDFSLRI